MYVDVPLLDRCMQVMLHENFRVFPDILYNYNEAVNNNKL